MFRNKLAALEHPTPGSIDCNVRAQFASTVLWLEDQKIRCYKIEDREALRNFGITKDWEPAWEVAYRKFQIDVGMPTATLGCAAEELSWLLSYAVRLEYLDNADEYKDITSAKVTESKKLVDPTIASTNPLDKMNMHSEEFLSGVRGLAAKLNVGEHHNHLLVLEAVSRVIYGKLRPEALLESLPHGTAFPIKEGDKCAFDDKDVDQAAKILRLLQIQNIRELQTIINETIVAVQQLTADPRTDSKLGLVGR